VSDTPIFMQMLSERGAAGGLDKWSGELRDRWSATTTTPAVSVQEPAEVTPSNLLIPQGGSAIKWQRVTPEVAKPPVHTPTPAAAPLSHQPLGEPGRMGAGLASQVPQDVAPATTVPPPQAQQQYSMPYGDVGGAVAAAPPTTPAGTYTEQHEVLQETRPMPTWQPAPQGVDPQASGQNAWGGTNS